MRRHKTIRLISKNTAFCLVLAAVILTLIILPAGCGGTNSNHTPGTVGIFIKDGPISADDSNDSVDPPLGATTVAQVWIRVSKIEAVTFDGVSTIVIWDTNDHPIAPPVDLLRHAFMPQFLGFATIPLGKYSKLIVQIDDGSTSFAPYFIPYNDSPNAPNYPDACITGTNCGLVLNANPSVNTSAGTPFTFTFSPALTIDDGSRGNIVIDFTAKIHYDDTTDIPGSPTPAGTPATPTPTPPDFTPSPTPTPTATPSPGTPTPHYVIQANSTTADANPSYFYGTNLLYVPMTVLGTTCSEGFLTARLDTQDVTVLVDRTTFLNYDNTGASCGDLSAGESTRVTGVLTERHQVVAGQIILPEPSPPQNTVELIGTLRKDPISGNFFLQTGANYGEINGQNLQLDVTINTTTLDERVVKTGTAAISNNQYVAVTGAVDVTNTMTVDTIRIFLDEDQ